MMTDGGKPVKQARAQGGAAVTRSLTDFAAVLLLLALSRWPAVVCVLPVLGVLAGPLGQALLGLAAAAALARVLAPCLPSGRPGTPALFALTAVVYAAVGLHYTSRLQASGDEPHYLLMAQSLWREGDLDLQDNIARGDWREYSPGPLVPHYGAPRRDGRPFPGHSPGLAVLLAPLYALGGRAACVVVLALVAAATTTLVRAWAMRLGAHEATALLAWAVAAGPPLLFYGFHVYGEAPSGLALLGALWLLAGPPRPATAVAAALLAVTLPFLHHKMIPAAAVIGLTAVLRLRGRALTAFLTAALAGIAVFLGYYQHVYGRPTPLALYEGLPRHVVAEPLRTLAGLLLDRSFGLLPHAPAYILGLAGLASWRRLAWRRAWPLAMAAVAVLAPVLFWRMWWGGQCPPGRFLLPALPILALAAAARGQDGEPGLWRWRWALVTVGLALATRAMAVPSELMLLNRAGRPDRLWAALDGVTAVERYLPSLTLAPGPAELRVAGIWVAALGLLLGLDRLGFRRPRVESLFRGLPLPLALGLVAGLLVDYWARALP